MRDMLEYVRFVLYYNDYDFTALFDYIYVMFCPDCNDFTLIINLLLQYEYYVDLRGLFVALIILAGMGFGFHEKFPGTQTHFYCE